LGLRILLTGGCGFIGSHTIREALSRKNIERLVNLDALTYSGHPDNVADINDDRYSFVHGSINDSGLVSKIINEEDIGMIVNLAAESHVDRSIHSVAPFVETNINGTRTILECIVERKREGGDVKLVQISTDEVYGSLGPDEAPFTEETPLDPRNPYAVTKASSDMMVLAFANTYGIEVSITRCSNNYGPNQFPEKLIPLIILNSLGGKSLPVYGDGMQIRDWIHARDHASGIIDTMEALATNKIKSGEVINFGADNEVPNIEIVRSIISQTGASEDLIEYVKDRPGHDRRYAMGFSKANRLLGWEPVIDWNSGIKETVGWYKDNSDWVKSVISGEYRQWVEKQYG
jgi:dTDP-glucose 4,6-dehydratase